jgi:hypothetical protein
MKKLAVLVPALIALALPSLAMAEPRHGRGGDDNGRAEHSRDDGASRHGNRGQGNRGNHGDRGENGRGPRGEGPPGRARNSDGARNEVRQGRRVALRDVIPNLQRRSPGRMLDSYPEEGPNGRPQYRVRWQSNTGERIDYIVDAETGAIIRRE